MAMFLATGFFGSGIWTYTVFGYEIRLILTIGLTIASLSPFSFFLKNSYDHAKDKKEFLMTLIPLGIYYIDLFIIFNSQNFPYHITKTMMISLCVYGLNCLKKLISIIAK